MATQMSDAYNALGAPADSPLPTAITPEMAQALQSYQGGPQGNLLARAGHAVFDEPLAALKGQMTESEAQDFAVRTALGMIGPMGMGKGAGLAMGMLGGLKKAVPDATEAALKAIQEAMKASNIASRTTSHFPLDEVEKALGGWDETAQMPANGSDWQAVGGAAPSTTTNSEFAAKNSWSAGKTPEQFAAHIATWPDTSVGNLIGHGLSSPYFKDAQLLDPEFAAKVKDQLPPALVTKAQKSAENYANYGNSLGTKMGPSSKLPVAAAPKPIEDSDIDSALAANPGASIFDLAGVSAPTPKKMPADEIGEKAAGLTETLPRGATWQMPEAAKAQGYNVAVHHGTRTSTIFDQFKLPDDEIGVHFGSPRAAQEIQGSSLNAQDAPRVYPAAIVAQNPVRLPDLGTWEAPKVARALVRNAGFSKEELAPVIGTDDINIGGKPSTLTSEQQAQNLRQYLASKGHDSIVYKNSVEDKGHDSYILFRESPTSPGHVYGARLPWADFDPSKFTSASIKAGIPLGAATGAYMSDQSGKLHELQDAPADSPHAAAAFPEDTQ